MKPITPGNGARRSLAIHKLISKIKDPLKRNLLRGYVSRETLSSDEIHALRQKNSAMDALALGALLRGPDGLLNETAEPKSAKDVFRLSSTQPVDWKSEINFVIGYVNSVEKRVNGLLPIFSKLALLEQLDSLTALELMLDLARAQGASNYLSYKLAYLRTARNLQEPRLARAVGQLEEVFGHRTSPGLHFSALENLSPKIALFSVAQRRISSATSRLRGNFRSALGLSNFVSTPIDEVDLASFILRASECSLCDTLYSLLTLLSLAERFPAAHKEIKLSLSAGIFVQLQKIVEHSSTFLLDGVVTEFYRSQSNLADNSLSLYRVASAFLERTPSSEYRHNLDRIVSARMLAAVIDLDRRDLKLSPQSKELLLAPSSTIIGGNPTVRLDTFMRTAIFLQFISDRKNFGTLTEDEVRFVFEHTMSLDSLLAEQEIDSFYLIAESRARALISVLALALFRAKSIDPDVDFEFRDDFVDLVCAEYGGSIQTFIEFLVEESPQVANYMVSSLDEMTLEKMYLLVKNATQASEIRQEILRAVGAKLKRVEFFIEADSIHTRLKIAGLQRYFDSSRMYVDSVALKKWLDSNPSVSTEQYKSLGMKRNSEDSDDQTVTEILDLNAEDEFLIFQIAKDAFNQFCTNNEFGIESYLGRRIRHNTLEGVTTAPVNAVLKKAEYGLLLGSPGMKRTVENWLQAYQDIIARLRHDRLQFEGPAPLFNSTLNADDTFTKENVKTLLAQLRATSGDELLNDLIIAFCWRQISPQLDNAARVIRTIVLTESIGSIDKVFSHMNGTIEQQLKADLRAAVNEVLRKVADWFQVPQTGFIPATVRQLVQIILDESKDEKRVTYSGDAPDNRYTGISVHRLYDCLAALLKNACSHGTPGETIEIRTESRRYDDGALFEQVSVLVISKVPDAQYCNAKGRISGAIDASETGDEMITEGYTGIRKVKFITRGSEGQHTVRFAFDDNTRRIMLGFAIRVECASDETRITEST